MELFRNLKFLRFFYWSFAGFFFVFLLFSCSKTKENSSVRLDQSEEKLLSQFFGKRRWCPKDKNFRYLESKHGEELDLRNYYKIQYFPESGKLAVESSYKDLDTPVGHWSFYDEQEQLLEERVFEKGKKIEEIIYEYDDQGYKRTETYWVYPNHRKRLRSKSLYFYTSYPHSKRKKLGKVEHYHTGILDEMLTFDYDSKGRVSKKMVYILNHRLKSYHLYNYSEDTEAGHFGNMETIRRVTESVYDSKDLPLAYMELRYNRKGSLLSRKKYDFDEGKYRFVSEISYQYDKKDLLVEKKERELEKELEKKERLSGRELGWLYRIQYDYDKEGCRVLERRMDQSGSVIEEFVY